MAVPSSQVEGREVEPTLLEDLRAVGDKEVHRVKMAVLGG